MNNKVRPSNGSAPPQLTDDTVRQLIAQQAAETQLRSQELAIRKAELDYQSKHASDILGAQERDREKERAHSRALQLQKSIFWGAVAALLIAFACLGMYFNKDSLVRDVLQIILSGLVGAFGGYGYARTHPPKKTDDSA